MHIESEESGETAQLLNHLLLLQLPAPTWWRTAICSYNSRGPIAFLSLLQAPRGAQTHRQNTQVCKIKLINKSMNFTEF